MIWVAAFWLIAAVSIQGPPGALCWAVFWTIAVVLTYRMIRPERR